MKNGLTEIIIIHDNNTPEGVSESMSKHGSKFFSTLKKAEADGEIRVTVGAFGENYKMYANDIPVAAVKLSAKYFNNGTGVRNIYDSAGKAIVEKGEAYSSTEESERPENIIFVLTTFGRDNASKNFTYEQIAEMVEHQAYVYKWKFFCLTSEPILAEQLKIPSENLIFLDIEEEEFFKKALEELPERLLSAISK